MSTIHTGERGSGELAAGSRAWQRDLLLRQKTYVVTVSSDLNLRNFPLVPCSKDVLETWKFPGHSEKNGSGCREEDLELISAAAYSAHCGRASF